MQQQRSTYVIDSGVLSPRRHTTPATRRLTSQTTSGHRDASAPAAWARNATVRINFPYCGGSKISLSDKLLNQAL
jgi:hypothetical protein